MSVGFLHGKPIDPAYPHGLGVLGAGHGVNGLARFFTKKNGGDGNSNGNGDDQPPPRPRPLCCSPNSSIPDTPAPVGFPTPGRPRSSTRLACDYYWDALGHGFRCFIGGNTLLASIGSGDDIIVGHSRDHRSIHIEYCIDRRGIERRP